MSYLGTIVLFGPLADTFEVHGFIHKIYYYIMDHWRRMRALSPSRIVRRESTAARERNYFRLMNTQKATSRASQSSRVSQKESWEHSPAGRSLLELPREQAETR